MIAHASFFLLSVEGNSNNKDFHQKTVNSTSKGDGEGIKVALTGGKVATRRALKKRANVRA